jgi:thiol-disulfide isomerase/thioredoxin
VAAAPEFAWAVQGRQKVTQSQLIGKQEIGAEVRGFALADLHGEQCNLDQYLEGKKGAVVVFWSGDCAHCVRYDPYLNSFTERHPELALVAVASRHGETLEGIRVTVAARGLAFPILHDPSGAVARQWFTQQTPRVFLLDAHRVLLYRGAIDNYKYPQDPDYQPYLEPAIASFLAGEPVARPETASFGCAIQSVYYILPNPL